MYIVHVCICVGMYGMHLCMYGMYVCMYVCMYDTWMNSRSLPWGHVYMCKGMSCMHVCTVFPMYVAQVLCTNAHKHTFTRAHKYMRIYVHFCTYVFIAFRQ